MNKLLFAVLWLLGPCVPEPPVEGCLENRPCPGLASLCPGQTTSCLYDTCRATWVDAMPPECLDIEPPKVPEEG